MSHQSCAVVCLLFVGAASMQTCTLILQVLLSIPGDVAVTREDVAADTTCARLAAGRSELVGLALWLISHRCKVHLQNPIGLAT